MSHVRDIGMQAWRCIQFVVETDHSDADSGYINAVRSPSCLFMDLNTPTYKQMQTCKSRC